MYFTSGSDRAFEQLMQGKPGFDHYDSGEAVTPEDCGTCRFYRPHWKYQFCVYAECPYQPGKLTAYDAVTFRVKGVENMAVFRVERNKGYTVMSNHHLRNKDLSLKAKGLLSQMLSLPEDWDYTLKGLSLINREQIDAIRAAIRELEQAGYIVRSRERDSQGRLRGADYVIYEQPQPVPDSPTLENPMLDNPTQEKPTLGKPTQLNKDISSKEKSITDVSITDPIPILSRPSPLEDEAAQPPERKGTEVKSQSAIEIYRQIIMDNIEYEHLCQHVKGIDRETLDEIVDLLVETVCSARKTIRIAGDDYPAELVKSKFMKLDSSHIEFVFDCLSKNTSEILRKRIFVRTRWRITSRRLQGVRGLLKLIKCEFWKLKRKHFVSFVVFAALLFPIPFTALVLAGSVGNFTGFDAVFGLLVTLGEPVMLPIVLGIVAAMLFFMERDNDTLKNLHTIPISPTKIASAKIAVLFILGLIYSLATLLSSMVGGLMAGSELVNIGEKIWISIITSLLYTASTLPVVIIIVGLNRSYIFSIIVFCRFIFRSSFR